MENKLKILESLTTFIISDRENSSASTLLLIMGSAIINVSLFIGSVLTNFIT